MDENSSFDYWITFKLFQHFVEANWVLFLSLFQVFYFLEVYQKFYDVQPIVYMHHDLSGSKIPDQKIICMYIRIFHLSIELT